MGLREKIKEQKLEKYFLETGWSVMPKGEVCDKNSIFKIFKYSDKVDLCAVCEIFKKRKRYKLVFRIDDLFGELIVKRNREGQEDEIFRWLERYAFGDAEAYLFGETNIKEIKKICGKYKRK